MDVFFVEDRGKAVEMLKEHIPMRIILLPDMRTESTRSRDTRQRPQECRRYFLNRLTDEI